MIKNYQRRHLRAPFKENMLYADNENVLKARVSNISEGGLLISEFPSVPEMDEIPVMFCLPQFPFFKNFSLLKLQTFSAEMFASHVVRARVRVVRRHELSQDLENVFKAPIGAEFVVLSMEAKKNIEDYVQVFTANMIYLQTLIDSFNTDDETKEKARTMAGMLGYDKNMKISQLRNQVTQDYKSLQWS